MKLPHFKTKLLRGSQCNLTEQTPRTKVLKVSFGGAIRAEGLPPDFPFDYSLYCTATGHFVGERLVGDGGRSILSAGAIRQTENRLVPGEWNDCFLVKLAEASDHYRELTFSGKFDRCDVFRNISRLTGHFLHLSDYETGEEILRVDVAPCNDFRVGTVDYGALVYDAAGKTWHFRFMSRYWI